MTETDTRSVLDAAKDALAAVRMAVSGALVDRTSSDLEEITVMVDSGLSEEQRAAMFRYLLYRYVQDVNRAFRNPDPPKLMREEGSTPRPAAAAPARDGRPRVDAQRRYVVNGLQFASANVAAVYSWWQQTRDGLYKIDGQSRRLGSLNIDEVLTVAQARRDDAAKNATAAARHESLAAAMRAAGVTTVDALDAQTARRCWETAA